METNRERIIRLETQHQAAREIADKTSKEINGRFTQANQWREALNDVVQNKVNRAEFDRRSDAVDAQVVALTLSIAEGRAADEARRRITTASLIVVSIAAPIITTVLIFVFRG